MNVIIRNIVALVLGIIIGSIVNLGLIMISSSIIPPPAGADVNTTEGLKAAIPFFEPKHYIFPFLAHALGTFVGAYVAARIATLKLLFAFIIGFYFLAGGIAMVIALPSPVWYNSVDLIFAYLPFAYLAGKLAKS